MDRADFMKIYWRYYQTLEEDFIRTINFVDLDENNFQTFSIEYAKQLQAICSEIDVLLKAICGASLTSSRPKMSDYAGIVKSKYPNIINENILVKDTGITLIPFENWNEHNAAQSLPWWNDYNGIKHDRVLNFTNSKLKNVLSALGGLYLLEMYHLKEICQTTQNHYDIPDRDSILFNIVGWETNARSMENMFFSVN